MIENLLKNSIRNTLSDCKIELFQMNAELENSTPTQPTIGDNVAIQWSITLTRTIKLKKSKNYLWV